MQPTLAPEYINYIRDGTISEQKVYMTKQNFNIVLKIRYYQLKTRRPFLHYEFAVTKIKYNQHSHIQLAATGKYLYHNIACP